MRLVTPALAVAAVVGVVPLTRWALAVDRGLDPQDESLYLLAVMAPDRDAFWMTPWSWVTEPLWQLAGAQVADYRLIGAVLLIGAFSCAWWALIFLTSRMSTRAAVTDHFRWGHFLLAVTGGLGSSALFYSGFIRSPGYNWANLIGIVLAATGLTLWTRLRRSQHVSSASWLAYALLGLGSFVALPAKPSTPVLLLALAGALALYLAGWIQAVRLVAGGAAALLVLVALALASGIWGSNPWQALVVMIGQPPAVPDQGWLSAIRELAKMPLHAAYWCLQLWYLSLVLLLLMLVARNPACWSRPRIVASGLLAAAGVLVFLSWTGWLPALTAPHNYVLRPEAVGSTIMLLVACVLVLLVDRRLRQRLPGSAFKLERERLALAAVFLFCAVIFAFGTANGPFQQMTWALGMMFLSIYAIVSLVEAPGLRRASFATIFGILVLCATWVITESWNFGYDLRPMSEQTHVIEVGGAGGQLSVDEALAERLQGLRSLADASGFKPGTSIIVVTDHWGAFEPVALNGTPVTSLMLGSGELAAYNVSRRGVFPWQAAWLLIAGTCISPMAHAELTELVTVRTRNPFPDGYRCTGSRDGVALWKPRK